MARHRCMICKEYKNDDDLDDRQLCADCAPKFDKKVEAGLGVINRSMDKVAGISSPHLKLKEYQKIIETASELIKLESLKVEVVPGGAQFLAEYYEKLQKNLIVHGLESEIRTYLQMTSEKKSDKAKLNTLSKLRQSILKFRDAADFYKAPLPKRLLNILDKIRLQEFSFLGKELADAGQVDQAVKMFQRALHQLENDDIDDSLQEKEIAYVKKAIKKLAG